jgi:hypothetical protein
VPLLAFFGLKEQHGQSGFKNAIDLSKSFRSCIKTIFLLRVETSERQTVKEPSAQEAA